MLDYKKCVRQGLLRSVPPSAEKARKSVEKAGVMLKQAKKDLEVENYDSCVMTSYAAMFNAARAILLRDGIRERSHYCAARYLESVYKGKLEQKWIDLLDRMRDLRHSDQYDVSFFATKSDASQALKISSDFIERIEKLLKTGPMGF